jgi:brefeldin A-resistance guanine nucleotide exchange factor 1
MYQTLFLHSLLPTPMLQMEDFLAGTSMIPLQVAPTSNARDDRRTDGGLLSALSSYLLSPYGGSSDAVNVPTCTDDEIEATLSTVDCLGSCRFEELYSQIM